MHLCQVGAALTQQYVAMGAEQAMQQLSALEGELSKRFEEPHQLAPVTPRGRAQRAISCGRGGRWVRREAEEVSES